MQQKSQCIVCIIEKEGNVLFNDALNTFTLYSDGQNLMVKDNSESQK